MNKSVFCNYIKEYDDLDDTEYVCLNLNSIYYDSVCPYLPNNQEKCEVLNKL